MRIKKEIVVIDWIKRNPDEGDFIKLTLSSDQRRILRGKRRSDCNQELHLQLPREGKLSDGDTLLTNQKSLFVKIIAQKENIQVRLVLIEDNIFLSNLFINYRTCCINAFTTHNFKKYNFFIFYIF